MKIAFMKDNKIETENVNVLGEGSVVGIDVFVFKNKYGQYCVTHKTSGYLVAIPNNNRLRNPERIIKEVEKKLIEKAGNIEILKKEFIKSIKDKEIINK